MFSFLCAFVPWCEHLSQPGESAMEVAQDGVGIQSTALGDLGGGPAEQEAVGEEIGQWGIEFGHGVPEFGGDQSVRWSGLLGRQRSSHGFIKRHEGAPELLAVVVQEAAADNGLHHALQIAEGRRGIARLWIVLPERGWALGTGQGLFFLSSGGHGM